MSYWVGSKNGTDGPFWVYDPAAEHPDADMVYLYSVFSNRMKEHAKFDVKREFNTVTGPRAEWAFEQYEDWRKDQGSTFLADDRPRAVADAEARLLRRRDELIERHKDTMAWTKKTYAGVSSVALATIREAHCWSCTRPLDSRLDVQCNACKWMVCSCGACGCGYAEQKADD